MAEGSTPALSAHDAAMVAKVEAAHAQNVQASTPTPIGQAPAGAPPAAPEAAPKVKPDDVPEKFWDAATGQVRMAELLKAHAELESARGKPAESKPAEGTPPAEGSAEEAAKAAKLDIAVLETEFAETGALTEASYKALEAAGFGKDVVDTYIAGQVALAAQRDAEGFALAGGKDQYTAMTAWAQTNMSPADVAAFDAAVTGSPAQMKQAITALKAQYVAANGNVPNLNTGIPAASSGETAFQSRAEVTAAMRDSRYRADPAYRALVERRIGLMDSF